MRAEVIQVTAVLVVVGTWVLADVYSRWTRRRADRMRGILTTDAADQRPEALDASALSASDD